MTSASGNGLMPTNPMDAVLSGSSRWLCRTCNTTFPVVRVGAGVVWAGHDGPCGMPCAGSNPASIRAARGLGLLHDHSCGSCLSFRPHGIRSPMLMRRVRDGAEMLLDVGDVAAGVPDGIDAQVRALEIESSRAGRRFSVRSHGVDRVCEFDAAQLGAWRGLKGKTVLVRTGALWGIPLAPVWDVFEILQSLQDLSLLPSRDDGDDEARLELAPDDAHGRSGLSPDEGRTQHKKVWSVWTNGRVHAAREAKHSSESGEFAVPHCGAATASSAAIVRWIRPIGGYASKGQSVGDLGLSERDGLFVIEDARVVHLTPDEWVARIGEEAGEAAADARAPTYLVLDVKQAVRRMYGGVGEHGGAR